MEELLNKLIEKGWKPFDVKWISEYFFESVPVGLYRLCWKKPDYDYNIYSKRDLVSKESGLWQFVCENGMAKIEYWKIREKYDETNPITDKNKVITYRQLLWEDNYEYRLIESALFNEEDLEKFLLDNIKIS